jgi:cyclophilin family peptidyl-prolyl cis-trans isomerase
VFGYIVSGMDVALAISKKQKDIRDRPLKDIKMDVNVIEMSTKELNEVHHIKRR